MNSIDPSQIELIKSIDEINKVVWNSRGVPITGVDLYQECSNALERSKSINYQFGVAQCLLNLGMGSFILKHDTHLALSQLHEANLLFKEIKNEKWSANSFLTIGIVFNSLGKAESALSNALRGISFYEKNADDIIDRTMAFYVLGTVYKDLKKYNESEKYYKIGVSRSVKTDSLWIGRIFSGLSNIYSIQGKYDEAINMGFKALDILKSDNNTIGESRALNDIGAIYKKQKKYVDALDYLSKGLEIRETLDLKQFALSSHIDIAELFCEIGQNENAIIHLKKAEQKAIETNLLSRLSKIYHDLASIYKSISDFQQALIYNEKYVQITIDTHENEIENKINSLHTELLREKEAEIERLKNVELKSAYNLIEIKNKEILDSINYAKRIQYALLAHEGLLNENLENYFVLFKPKDIVSGDFYWATKKGDDFFLACCDSTGHGVPGAFMSLLNISFLNEAINEKNIVSPDQVLNHVRDRLIQNLDGGQDGMDATLLRINKNKISYASSNNSPLLIRDKQLILLNADKMPVGKGYRSESFSLYDIDIKAGDTLYFFTDGFADQFGGSDGKKYKYKQLANLLLSNVDEDMEVQKEKLNDAFNSWQGNLEQVDDVCIIGIKF
ncbi:MAG: SpoIIE family protein phosphatase [Bacteroidetes bacterium]|nr:SpoIIE family protein phosphatase [Bacteroidota bacterium]